MVGAQTRQHWRRDQDPDVSFGVPETSFLSPDLLASCLQSPGSSGVAVAGSGARYPTRSGATGNRR